MDLAKEGAHEVQGAHRGVLKEGEGLQDEAASGCQHPQGCHHLTVVQCCCAHLLPATACESRKASGSAYGLQFQTVFKDTVILFSLQRDLLKWQQRTCKAVVFYCQEE